MDTSGLEPHSTGHYFTFHFTLLCFVFKLEHMTIDKSQRLDFVVLSFHLYLQQIFFFGLGACFFLFPLSEIVSSLSVSNCAVGENSHFLKRPL